MTTRLDRHHATGEATQQAAPELGDGSVPAVVFPSPLTTLVACSGGIATGGAAVYSLALLHIAPLHGLVVLALIFAAALAGPQVLARARHEWSRALAVALNGLAFGGVFGGLAVWLFL